MKNDRRNFLKMVGLSGVSLAITGNIPAYAKEVQYSGHDDKKVIWPENIQTILDNTEPLKYSRGKRLPLYLWPAIDPGKLDDNIAEQLVQLLDKRGIGIICSWDFKDVESSLSKALPVACAQKKLGQRINIDATSLLNSFYDGDTRTAHLDGNGQPFFDDSFGKGHKMGCPFAIDFRKDEIRKRVEFFAKKYKAEGIDVDFIYTDWEIDGPITSNGAYEASKKCTRCTKHLGEGFTYEQFQKTMQTMRAYLQYDTYSKPVLSHFPKALVGNYGDYRGDGYRYWYDYFEHYQPWQPYKADQNAKYRKWYNNFQYTGFTFAMPVVYTWGDIYDWYDFKDISYRWFYNMLLVASNAGKSANRDFPVISFVHWTTFFLGKVKYDPALQMSGESYQELLWHMLLRKTDTFFMYSGKKDFPKETKLVHEVYAAAQEYGEFLENGWPINYEVPQYPGVVISGLACDGKVLVRRTDFGTDHAPVKILAGIKEITVSYTPGLCQIIEM